MAGGTLDTHRSGQESNELIERLTFINEQDARAARKNDD
ncbi:MAG: hypothetical protein ACI9XK_000592 [Granulosicoccus sp.]|jgi:hypothetical protein